ncbi:OsmC family protein [Vreelandella jeotgali]|uniref:OsmC family protein n=1 Tax=Vreelandella jeotgali TaxID=553386 RepID=UPI000347422B|nr:OsmC family protein [Halomonas jeotgali]
MDRHASAHWAGGLKDGKGTVSSESGVLDARPYNFGQRFENEPGTNPEELIGAAHASCFSMALSLVLGESGYTPDEVDTQARVTIRESDDGFEIPAIHLDVTATVPGADDAAFQQAAEGAKAGCPVSKLFNAEITLNATLQNG